MLRILFVVLTIVVTQGDDDFSALIAANRAEMFAMMRGRKHRLKVIVKHLDVFRRGAMCLMPCADWLLLQNAMPCLR